MGWRATIAAVLAALAVPLGGCGLAKTVPAETTTAADAAPEIKHESGPPGYRDLLETTFSRLESFWNNQLPDLGARPGSPKHLVQYWNGNQDPGCGGQRVGRGNAAYCAPSQTIAWDANWIYGRLYRQYGDAAVTFVLAHEYGHFIQDRLQQRRFPLTIESELNADCLAGAFIGTMDRKVSRLHGPDFQALAEGLFNVADPRGVPWTNPSAHGRVGERRHALLMGIRHGQRGCQRWLGPGFSR